MQMTDMFAGFYIKIEWGRTEFIAYAKREPFVGCSPTLMEPGDLWFEFGNSPSEARDKLIESLGFSSHD
jgi:hypothetical protein